MTKRSQTDGHKPTPDTQAPAPGAETITQRKPDIAQGLAQSAGHAGFDSIGTGSVEETAPATRSTISDPDRVVQQGDEVVVHGRAIIDGLTSMPGRVIKVNQDGSVAVRVQRGTGQFFDIPGKVHNADQGDGSFYWTWPADGEETLPPAGKPVDDGAADVDRARKSA